jgi:hypothetical protein
MCVWCAKWQSFGLSSIGEGLNQILYLSLQPDQPLILYVSATHTIVGRALVLEREISKDGRKQSHQVPIYFVSKALIGSRKYFSEMEKTCYVVVMSARKLRHYFKAH